VYIPWVIQIFVNFKSRVVTYRFPVKGKNLSKALPMERQENLPSWRLA